MAMSAGYPFEVMIVDDEPADARLVKLALAQGQHACNITLAGHGQEALSLLRRPNPDGGAAYVPDLILLDLNMPLMNGRELLKELKADESLRLIPVVVLSTSDAERDITAAYSLGAAGYVAKPVDLEELFAAMSRVLDYWFATVLRPPRG